MEPQAWLQLFLTVCTMIVSMVVFYFKSEQVLRKEILASEERVRGDVKEIRSEVSDIDKRVAVIEALDANAKKDDSQPRGRLPSGSGRY